MNLYVVTDKVEQKRIWVTAKDVREAFDVIEGLIAEDGEFPNFKPDVIEYLDRVYGC